MEMAASEAFLLLNSDAIVNKSSIINMINLLFQNKKTGIVGPLSNAASTQSVPYITNTTYQTAINELPKGYTIDDMVDVCQKLSDPFLMPVTQLVHGFCQLIKTDVYKTIHGFDEDAFPNGYGEENDFCLRAINAGYDCKICTSAFIYHKKSASYKNDKVRLELMKNGAKQLRRKHGHDRMTQAITIMEKHPLLENIRKEIIRECFHKS